MFGNGGRGEAVYQLTFGFGVYSHHRLPVMTGTLRNGDRRAGKQASFSSGKTIGGTLISCLLFLHARVSFLGV